MADDQEVTQVQTVPEDVNTEAVKTATPAIESTYTRQEIIAGAEAFGTSRHVVAGALRSSDKNEFTRAEAEALIHAFLKKEV